MPNMDEEEALLMSQAPPTAMMSQAPPTATMSQAPPTVTPPPAPPLVTGAPPPPLPPPRADRSGALFTALGGLSRKDLTATQGSSERSSNVYREGKDIDPRLLAEEQMLRTELAKQELRRIDEAEKAAAFQAYLEPKRDAAVSELRDTTDFLRSSASARRFEEISRIQKEIEEESKKDFWESRTTGQIVAAILGGIASAFTTPDVAAGYFDSMVDRWRARKQEKLASLEKRRGLTNEYWDLYKQQLDEYETKQLDRINRMVAVVASRGLPEKEAAEFAAWFQKNRENPSAGISPQSFAAVKKEKESAAKAIEAKKAPSAKDKATLARLREDARLLDAMAARTEAALMQLKPVTKDVTSEPIPQGGTDLTAKQQPLPPWSADVLKRLEQEDRKVRDVLGTKITKDVR